MKYYRLLPIFEKGTPLLAPDKGCPRYLFEREKIENPEFLLYRIRKPIPRKPILGDFMVAPQIIVSEIIYNSLSQIEFGGVQFLPCKIDLNGNTVEGYRAIHSYNRLFCIDLNESVCNFNDGNLSNVQKLILDKRRLENIPLRERLIFRAAEDYSYQLFHESIVEEIARVVSKGIRYISFEDWDGNNYFK
jgi:hypothetical protein